MDDDDSGGRGDACPCRLQLLIDQRGRDVGGGRHEQRPSSSAVGTSSNADLCQALVAEKAKLKVLGDSFASKVDLSDLAGTKQALSDLLSGANSVVADSASLMSSAPQDVQDALTTIKDTLSSTASGIQSASSFQDLDNLSHAFDSSDMKSAVNTVSDYIGGQCG